MCREGIGTKKWVLRTCRTANTADYKLIQRTAEMVVEHACLRISGVCGLDEDQGHVMRCIEFPRIKGGKPFDTTVGWFTEMLDETQ